MFFKSATRDESCVGFLRPTHAQRVTDTFVDFFFIFSLFSCQRALLLRRPYFALASYEGRGFEGQVHIDIKKAACERHGLRSFWLATYATFEELEVITICVGEYSGLAAACQTAERPFPVDNQARFTLQS